MLLTMHKAGVAIWGGPDWAMLQRFEHQFVDEVSFSPTEQLLITCNTGSAPAAQESDQQLEPVRPKAKKIGDICAVQVRDPNPNFCDHRYHRALLTWQNLRQDSDSD